MAFRYFTGISTNLNRILARIEKFGTIPLAKRHAAPTNASLCNFSTSSQNKNNDSKKPNDNSDKHKKWLIGILTTTLLADFLILKYGGKRDGPGGLAKRISWTDFVTEVLPSGKVSKIVVHRSRQKENEKALVYIKYGAKTDDMVNNVYSVVIPSPRALEEEVSKVEKQLPPTDWIIVQYNRPDTTVGRWLSLLILCAFCLVGYKMYNASMNTNLKSTLSTLMKSRFTVLNSRTDPKSTKLKTSFKDVAGCHEAKVEIKEFIQYLHNPHKFVRLGARLPHGALLTGAPGCGKTLLARALAAESNVPFIAVNGPEFVEMVGGLGASRIRSLFEVGRSNAPCIIYIDEIDALGKQRSEGIGAVGASREGEQTLNQLLVEMDGIESGGKGIVVLASTNRPEVLDKALLRPGRFDRHISIDLPVLKERKELFEYYLSKISCESEVYRDIDTFAHATAGMSGAEIGNIVNESAIYAASLQIEKVNSSHVQHAIERITHGAKRRNHSILEEERKVRAFHEAGRALVNSMMKDTHAVMKISIIPRTSHRVGYNQYMDNDKKLYSQEELFARMCEMLGGRCAENLKFGNTTTAAEEDLRKVTKLAERLIKQYGMSSTIGPLSFSEETRYASKPYSDKMAAMIDQEVSSLVAKSHKTAQQILEKNIKKLDLVAKTLLEKETLTHQEINSLLATPNET